jgi:hypothetical protein
MRRRAWRSCEEADTGLDSGGRVTRQLEIWGNKGPNWAFYWEWAKQNNKAHRGIS